MVMNQETEKQSKKPRKRPVRSPYLFPSYDFGVARRITETVERDGGGTLSEETLAIALGASAKSSGFRLRTLAARQFGLLTKQGDILRTTPLAKAIIKPTSEAERDRAIIESFLTISLFKVIATRFKGQPLPQRTAFRNILEREFKIESNRVNEAERIFLDSAREAGILQASGSNVYLVTQPIPASQPSPTTSYPAIEGGIQSGDISQPPPASGFLTILEEDLAEFSEEEFTEIWQALGKVVRARGKRQRAKEEPIMTDKQWEEEIEKEEQ